MLERGRNALGALGQARHLPRKPEDVIEAVIQAVAPEAGNGSAHVAVLALEPLEC